MGGQSSGKYKNVSNEFNDKLVSEMNWLFFEDYKTKKIIAENLDKKSAGGFTALHKAAYWTDDAEIARMLVEAGVNINVQDDNGEAALHWAARWNRLKIGKFLLEAGAKLDVRNKWNETPLDIANDFDYEEFVAMIDKKNKKIRKNSELKIPKLYSKIRTSRHLYFLCHLFGSIFIGL